MREQYEWYRCAASSSQVDWQLAVFSMGLSLTREHEDEKSRVSASGE